MPASGIFSRRNTLRFTSLGILSLAVIPMLTACGKDYQGEVKLDSYDESAGSYEPATKEHPAQNVPKPKKPQDINDDSTGGLYSTLAFAAAAMQYALRTGDTSYLQEVNIPERTKVFFMSTSKLVLPPKMVIHIPGRVISKSILAHGLLKTVRQPTLKTTD